MTGRRSATAAIPDATGDVQLSREQIIDAAIHLARESGLKALTMRRLAAELGVTAAAMYYYVPNKTALVRDVADAVLDTVNPPDSSSSDWVAELRRYSLEVQDKVRQHPGVAALFVRETQSPAMVRHVDAVLGVLLAVGFAQPEALDAFSTLTTYTLGSAILHEQHLAAIGRDDVRGRLRPAAELAASGALRQVRSELQSTEERDYFGYGLDLILDGLRARSLTQTGTPPQQEVTAGRRRWRT